MKPGLERIENLLSIFCLFELESFITFVTKLSASIGGKRDRQTDRLGRACCRRFRL